MPNQADAFGVEGAAVPVRWGDRDPFQQRAEHAAPPFEVERYDQDVADAAAVHRGKELGEAIHGPW